MARFYIGSDSSDYFISTNACSFALNSTGGWVTYTVPVAVADFMAWPGQTGTASFADVAANAVYVGLLFTSADFSAADNSYTLLGLTSANGATTLSITNFGNPDPAPMPPAFLLFGPRIAALVAIRRRWRH
jgi:hypothetical protein